MSIPNALRRAASTAHVSPALRALLSNVPDELHLTLTVGGHGPWPDPIPELVKLGDLLERLTLELHVGEDAGCRLEARHGEAQVTFVDGELGPTLESVADRLLVALLTHDELGQLMRRVAMVGSTTTTLQLITTHMLSRYDLKHALYVMLGGITAGYCLGFHRAALFRYDAETATLDGMAAIGPDSEEEAHRIWEGVEVESRSIVDLIESFDPESLSQSAFQARVETIRIPLAQADDELLRALAIREPTRFVQATIDNPHLSGLGTSGEFVLAPIRAHQRLLGLLFADNRYGRRPIDELRLTQLRFFIDQTALIWENFELLARERDLARRDPLTGALNRREFDRLAAEHLAALAPNQTMALLLIDIDQFKRVNDRLGHLEGDRILRAACRLIGSLLRENDLLCRWGGDEFVALLPSANRESAMSVAERLLKLARERLSITLSIGVAGYPEDGRDIDTLFSVSDRRLYHAKELGRDMAINESS
ncbi:MAG: GGDEF domain-containing protein [Myxococcales bacterium]|nr:GGDEF domain-containing protein [Myxococcales bacterium]